MNIAELIHARFGETGPASETAASSETLHNILDRRSHRDFRDTPVDDVLLQNLFATAFSAPSKSDLQQATVIHVRDRSKQGRIARLTNTTAWAENAPVLLVWCGDSRRIRRLAEWRDHAFANDHLDAFMNAAVDAGICMQTFIIAAESVGLGCCPLSELRNNVDALSAELELPEHVFPVAGLCVGWPARDPGISMRLPMSVTVHQDRYDDSDLLDEVAGYDRRREAARPTAPEQQRLVEQFGIADNYGWSENRTRQYSVPARADFGAYIRRQGFDLS